MSAQPSCDNEEAVPKCSFTFKDKTYKSNTINCSEDVSGVLLSVYETWKLDIDSRVNYIRLETKESTPLYYDSFAGDINREENTLTFSGTLDLEKNGITYTGDISGKCTCTDGL